MQNQLENQYYLAKIKHLEASIKEKEANIAKISKEIDSMAASNHRAYLMFELDFLIKMTQFTGITFFIKDSDTLSVEDKMKLERTEKAIVDRVDRIINVYLKS